MFKPNKKKLAFAAIIISSVLALAIFTNTLKQPFLTLLRIPLSVATFAGREIKGIIFYHRNMVQSDALRKESGLLKQRLNELEEAKNENARLKSLLSIKTASPYKVIASKVIARSADNWTSVVIIDKGRYHGIRKGAVVTGFNGLVGRIIEAQEKTSKVMLINDPNLSVSAVVQRSRQEGLVCGALGAQLIMKYLPRDADIAPSDTVVTSGFTESYPKGIVIGKVVEVGEDFSGLSCYAVIKPSVNLSNIEEVLVIIQ